MSKLASCPNCAGTHWAQTELLTDSGLIEHRMMNATWACVRCGTVLHFSWDEAVKRTVPTIVQSPADAWAREVE